MAHIRAPEGRTNAELGAIALRLEEQVARLEELVSDRGSRKRQAPQELIDILQAAFQ